MAEASALGGHEDTGHTLERGCMLGTCHLRQNVENRRADAGRAHVGPWASSQTQQSQEGTEARRRTRSAGLGGRLGEEPRRRCSGQRAEPGDLLVPTLGSSSHESGVSRARESR